ncbi:MAG TPA: hypothetical protein VKH44_12520 [Pirellulaceae bacterium]|nr:hypothetical protein [Pirellulaceae bacterium]
MTSPAEPETLSTRAAIPAWLMSFILHFSVLTLGAIFFRVAPRGIEEPGRGVGIVLTQTSLPGQAEYFADSGEGGSNAGGAPLTGGAAQSAVNAAIPLPGPEQLPQTSGPQLPKGLANLGLPGEEEGLPGAGGLTKGGSSGKGGIGGKGEATVNVFGVQGTGNRFIYVFDRSLSMSGYGGRPLAAAKRELIKSLDSLGSVHQFQIVFYNEEPKVFNTRPGQSPQLVFGSDENKEQAESFVQSITADGGTQHMDALFKALSLSPDVIFFLTDADDPKLTDADLMRLRKGNRGGAVINCIEYGSGASQGDNNFLKRLAAQNRGHHVYVDVSRLAK